MLSRADFLKSMLGSGLVLTVPSLVQTGLPGREVLGLRIYQAEVAGFKHHQGPQYLDEMKPGDSLDLVLEPDNPYDERAVAVYWQTLKLGYLPMKDNKVLQALVAAGLPCYAQIEHLDHQAPTWKQLRLGFYLITEESLLRPTPIEGMEPAHTLRLREKDDSWEPIV